MAWNFKIPPEEMDEKGLANELISITLEEPVDLDALNTVLDVLKRKYPLQEHTSAEESFAAFKKQYMDK